MTVYDRIKSLLELGTLKGVRVESIFFIMVQTNGRILDDDGEFWGASKINSEFSKVEITPIPQKPKVLEVGTKVRFIDGLDPCVGVISKVDSLGDKIPYSYQIKGCGDGIWAVVSPYSVVPVFEEEEEKDNSALRMPAAMEDIKAGQATMIDPDTGMLKVYT